MIWLELPPRDRIGEHEAVEAAGTLLELVEAGDERARAGPERRHVRVAGRRAGGVERLAHVGRVVADLVQIDTRRVGAERAGGARHRDQRPLGLGGAQLRMLQELRREQHRLEGGAEIAVGREVGRGAARGERGCGVSETKRVMSLRAQEVGGRRLRREVRQHRDAVLLAAVRRDLQRAVEQRLRYPGRAR